MKLSSIHYMLCIICFAIILMPSKGHRGFSAESRFYQSPLINRPKFDAQNAMQLVRQQLSFGSRTLGRPGHQLTKAFLEKKLLSFSDHIFLQEFNWHDYKLTNLIAWVCKTPPPSLNKNGPPRKSKTYPCPGNNAPVLLSTHWDTYPYAIEEQDKSRRRWHVPGANDGGSGTAVLLELARGMMKARPPKDILVVLFDGEDYGIGNNWIIGSRYFAKNLPKPHPTYGINIDMVGDRNLNIHVEKSSEERAPHIVRKILNAARRIGAKSFHPDVKYHLLDDHIPLNDAGIPTANIIDFDYPYWHTSKDTLDKISPQSLSEVARVLIESIYWKD